MPWINPESVSKRYTLATMRPGLPQNGPATNLHLLSWTRGLLYVATLGLLTINVVLYLWHRQGSLWKDAAAELWGVYAIGLALLMLGNAVLVLGMISDGTTMNRRARLSRACVFAFALSAALGIVGLVGSVALLVQAWPG